MFAHVALCGHGTAGSIWLRDRTRLTQRDVVTAAHRAGFRGHLLSIERRESWCTSRKTKKHGGSAIRWRQARVGDMPAAAGG
jgi:predicted PhzF superfamily epimerase YddE/YHI9